MALYVKLPDWPETHSGRPFHELNNREEMELVPFLLFHDGLTVVAPKFLGAIFYDEL